MKFLLWQTSPRFAPRTSHRNQRYGESCARPRGRCWPGSCAHAPLRGCWPLRGLDREWAMWPPALWPPNSRVSPGGFRPSLIQATMRCFDSTLLSGSDAPATVLDASATSASASLDPREAHRDSIVESLRSHGRTDAEHWLSTRSTCAGSPYAPCALAICAHGRILALPGIITNAATGEGNLRMPAIRRAADRRDRGPLATLVEIDPQACRTRGAAEAASRADVA